MHHVTINANEYAYAAHAGFLRQVSNICKHRKDAYGFQGDGFEAHVTGAVGEFVASIALRLPWRGPGTLRAADVGESIQVRTTTRTNGSLILHPHDSDDAIFVLVSGAFPEYCVVGWLRGKNGKRQEYWQEPIRGRAAFFVPQARLAAVELLHEQRSALEVVR